MVVMEVHHVNSSPDVTGSGGLRLLNKAALPFTREMESRWKSLWMVVLSSSPVCLARALPSFFSSAMAVGCQAPRHSTAKGRNSMPWRWQASQDLSSFRRWASPRAWPAVAAAPWTWAAWRGLITVTSRAASLPADQWGMKMSAGLPPSPDQLKHPSIHPKTQTDTNRHCEMSSNTPRQPSDTPYIHDQVRLEPILHVGKTVKGKIFFTYLFWDIKISKPDYLPFLKMSEFCHFLKFSCLSERNYNLQSLWITLYLMTSGDVGGSSFCHQKAFLDA